MVVSQAKSALAPVQTPGVEPMNCFIGPDAHFSGEMVFHGVMQLDGYFSGLIASPTGTLMVSPGSEINASIEVAAAEIRGVVKGDICAREQLVLKPSANVTADVETPSLVIEDGAVFEGRCRMTGGPSAAVAVRRKLRSLSQQR